MTATPDRNGSPFYTTGKRAFDVAFSVGLMLLASPLLIAAGLLVKLTSKGPVFFRQVRIGYDGRPFTLYKFRSMYVEAPAYAFTPTSDDDPRVTQVGRFLRPSSIDELPQLINVLRGDMSVVGPRPEMPFIVETYSPELRQRLAVKPGLTGLWQISPARYQLIHENPQYDFYYIENASFVLDMRIVAQTVALILRDTVAAAGRLYVRLSAPRPRHASIPEPLPVVARPSTQPGVSSFSRTAGPARDASAHASVTVGIAVNDE